MEIEKKGQMPAEIASNIHPLGPNEQTLDKGYCCPHYIIFKGIVFSTVL